MASALKTQVASPRNKPTQLLFPGNESIQFITQAASENIDSNQLMTQAVIHTIQINSRITYWSSSGHQSLENQAVASS